MKYKKIIALFFIIGCGNNDKFFSKEEFSSFLKTMQDNKQILIKKKEEFFQKKDFSSCKEYFNSIISFLEYLKDFTKKNEEKKITEADYQKIIDLFSSDNFSSSLKEEEKLIDTTISSFEEYEQTEIQKLQFKILDVQKEFFELKKKYA